MIIQQMKKNLFIAFEGIDGSGKSTQVKLLAEALEQNGHKVYTTCEPTDSAIGTLIRKIFKHEMEADHRTIAALFAADRLDHLLNKQNGILNKLEQGYTVITDRYYFSSYAYHSVHTDMDWVISLNQMSATLLRPDLIIYLDIQAEQSMERLKKGREAIELYETLENLRSVRSNYLTAFDLFQSIENIYKVDANRSTEAIATEIKKQMTTILPLR